MPKKNQPSRLAFTVLALILLSASGAGVLLAYRPNISSPVRLQSPQFLAQRFYAPQPVRMERPEGMAPVAFDAFIRACHRTKIHPRRIGQTMGDHPRSVGYHKRDGTLTVDGQKLEYSAAVDVGTGDLSRQKIDAFVDALAAQGFAVWYRHGPKWKNGEHIHAVYAFLPMKPQLQGQLSLFLRERRRDGRPVPWEKKLRSQRRKLKHWSV